VTFQTGGEPEPFEQIGDEGVGVTPQDRVDLPEPRLGEGRLIFMARGKRMAQIRP